MTQSGEPTTAQTAFDLFDTEGETAMLSFLLENELPPANSNKPPTHFTFPDGSQIIHLRKNYCTVSADGHITAQRPARVSILTNPALLGRHQPIIRRPDATSIMRDINQQAALKAQEVLGIEPDDETNPLTLLDIINSAPSFHPALQAVLRDRANKPLPGRRIYDYLDQEVSDQASATLSAMPQEDFDALVNIAIQRINHNSQTTQPTTTNPAEYRPTPDETVETIPHPYNPSAPRLRVLIDFDLKDPHTQVLDTTPADFSAIPVQAVKTIFTDNLIIHIYAHEGQGQDVADLFAARPDLDAMIASHALLHTHDDVNSFTLNALSRQQVGPLWTPLHRYDPHGDPSP